MDNIKIKNLTFDKTTFDQSLDICDLSDTAFKHVKDIFNISNISKVDVIELKQQGLKNYVVLPWNIETVEESYGRQDGSVKDAQFPPHFNLSDVREEDST
ncbi:hypothetical protein PUN28_009823 [Cardiocondyla obscurior]|uniref:Uncharacterized protein n=1 Tax=Cardiocondyla obscurior TaxID=286306 RepID=A0AAW2F6F3_9HYME